MYLCLKQTYILFCSVCCPTGPQEESSGEEATTGQAAVAEPEEEGGESTARPHSHREAGVCAREAGCREPGRLVLCDASVIGALKVSLLG